LIGQEEALDFVQRWVSAWNAHDVERVLAHFAEDVVFTSPVAARMLPESKGVFRDKASLRAYWSEALERLPDLRFEVVGTYVGIDHIVINYRNHVGGSVCEVLRIADGVVVEGHGTYTSNDAAAASGIDVPVG
jgi:ketosteroid isomerase-like protein